MSAQQGYQGTFQFTSPATDASGKRRRGATPRSCAECRRLKLRCTRVFPCVSCVKRGCGAICPEGALTTGQGNRFVLASTEELHEKIQALSYRVRALEDGLKESHAKHSQDCHPLLEPSLLALKAPLQRPPRRSSEGDVSPDISVLDWSDFTDSEGSHAASGSYPPDSHSPFAPSGLLTPPHSTTADASSSTSARTHGSTPSPLSVGGHPLPHPSSGRYQSYGSTSSRRPHPQMNRHQFNPSRSALFEQDSAMFSQPYPPSAAQLSFVDDPSRYGGYGGGTAAVPRSNRQTTYGPDVWELPHDILY